MSKLNVLQLMTDSKIGGAERVVLSLAKGLNKEKFNVSVCCLASRGPIFDEIEKAGIEIYTLGIRNRWDFIKILKLSKLLRTKKIHILHSHLFHANILARVIGKFMGIPIIISTEHIMGLEGKWRLFLNRITSVLVDKFIAVSFAVKDFLIDCVKIDPSKIDVIHNGIEYDNCPISEIAKENKKKEFGLGTTDKILGTVARIHRQKGHIYLLHAVKEVIGDFPEAKFLIIGEGPLKSRMEKLSRDLRISKNIIFTGFQDDIPILLSILDIFVLPSLWEGLPITILEAMSMKKPVIATSVSGNPEIIEDNITGILVPPRDPDSLAKATIKLLKDVDLRFKMGEAGYKRGKDFFNVQRMIEDTGNIYKQLINEKNIKVDSYN